MPKLSSPILGEDIHGPLGGLVTFATHPRGRVLRLLPAVKYLVTQRRLAVNAVIGFLSSQWPILPTDEKTSWISHAHYLNLQPINAFQAENAKLARRAQPLTAKWPYQRLSGPGSANPPTFKYTPRTIELTLTTPSAPPSWAYIIYRNPGVSVTATWDRVVAYVPPTGANTLYYDTPLPAGQYAYRVRPLGRSHLIGSVSAQAVATLP